MSKHKKHRYDKIGNVYCLEYTDIPKVFFTPHHGGQLPLGFKGLKLPLSLNSIP
jgi:hypothetical protein